LLAAAKHSMAMSVPCWGQLEEAGELGGRNLNTRLFIDRLLARQNTK
jgi:hypothetical protein